MPDSRPAPLRELLCHEQRLPRIDVRRRAGQCRRVLAKAQPDPAADVPALARAFNRSALLFAAVGDLAEAEGSCLRQLIVLDRLSRDPGHRLDALAHAFQPWINLGRLRVIQGRADRALEHFQLYDAYLLGTDLPLGPMTLTADDLLSVKVSRLADQLCLTLANVSVLETAKAHCRARAFGDLGAAAHAWARRPEFWLIPQVAEAARIAEANGYDGPSHPAGRLREFWPTELIRRTDQALNLHKAYARLARGDNAGARELGLETLLSLRADAIPAGHETGLARMSLRLGDLLLACDVGDLAAECHEHSLRLAKEHGDEPAIAAALRALTNSAEPERAQEAAASLEGLLDRTLYLELRRTRPGNAPLHAHEVPELAELLQLERALAAGTGGPR